MNNNRNTNVNNVKRLNVLDIYVRDNGGSLNYMTTDEIQKYALRIFKDIAYGNIDSKDIGDKYVEFFNSPTVLENLKVVISQKLFDSKIKYTSIDYYFNNTPEGETLSRTVRGIELYQSEYSIFLMYSTLNNILEDAIENPKNRIRILFCIEYNLSKYKRYLNKLI